MWWESREFIDACTNRHKSQSDWDDLFMSIANLAAGMSKCASRKCGAMIVKDTRIVSFGYNGAPSGSSLCQFPLSSDSGVCPRKRLNLPSGAGVELCPAQHAERNAITNAARQGTATLGTTIYVSATVTPCQQCAGAIINAGIKELVCGSDNWYDSLAKRLLEESDIVVRFI
jgi:dCMP deaminase